MFNRLYLLAQILINFVFSKPFSFSILIFLKPFFDIVLGPPFLGFWCQLGTNLPPHLGPKSFPNPSKSHPKSIQNRILFLIPFLIEFCKIFGRFSTPKSTKTQSKIDHKSIPTTQQPKSETS